MAGRTMSPRKHTATLWVRMLIAVSLAAGFVLQVQGQDYVRDSAPQLFSYDELVQLGQKKLAPQLAEKLKAVLTTNFINNEAYLSGARPGALEVPELGPTLRVAFWNIERGLELDNIQLFLPDKDAFMAKVEAERKKAKKSGKRDRNVDM